MRSARGRKETTHETGDFGFHASARARRANNLGRDADHRPREKHVVHAGPRRERQVDHGAGANAAALDVRLPVQEPRVLADVVAVNGKPAKGTFAAWGSYFNFSAASTPVPARPIADISRTQMWNMLFEVHDAEKGQVATLAALGLAGGPPPPGTLPGSLAGNFVVTGGSGAWSGVKGHATTVSIAGARGTSGSGGPGVPASERGRRRVAHRGHASFRGLSHHRGGFPLRLHACLSGQSRAPEKRSCWR